MRLNDKLIRKNCPACGGEITLGTSALNKKINCPKCRQTVVIANGAHSSAAKLPSKKTVPKEKRNGHGGTAGTSPDAPGEQRIFIQRLHDREETPGLERYGAPLTEKKAVVYCICNGVLKKCRDCDSCCVQSDCPVHADAPAY